ncbi:zinc finger protein ZFP2-like [Oppia nitens]|uniref:zinc finger protein ZFP2-like n=1 Tax=Oppia nitens TaxID=1686743 RepID=UPI0023D9EF78|nr:zinc finger protein ZFP2-like [Oppia nitens]
MNEENSSNLKLSVNKILNQRLAVDNNDQRVVVSDHNIIDKVIVEEVSDKRNDNKDINHFPETDSQVVVDCRKLRSTNKKTPIVDINSNNNEDEDSDETVIFDDYIDNLSDDSSDNIDKVNDQRVVCNDEDVVNSDGQQFRCSTMGCCKAFKMRRQLTTHVRLSHLQVYQCDYKECQYKTGNKYVFEKHKSRHRSGDQLFKCNFADCSVTMNTRQALRYHQLNEHPDQYKPINRVSSADGNYKCTKDNCSKVFATMKYLKKHISVCHRETYKCQYNGCHYKTGDKQVYKTHKLKHSNKKSVNCDYNDCNAVFNTQLKLKSHKLRKHADQYPDIPWLKCPHTGCTFKSKSNLAMSDHNKRHTKPYKCDECGISFGSSSNLKAHLTTHNSALKYKCEWPGCDRLYGVKYQFDDHMNTHTNEKTYRCDRNNCNNIVFKTVRTMRLHNLSKHPDEYPDIQWRKCSYTGCTFRSKASTLMFDHKKRHLKPYKCNECDKQFSSDKCLKLHLATHNSALKIACEWPGCERRLTTKGKLNEHMNSHTADKTYRCNWPDCDKSYNLKAGLTSHIRRTHNGKADYRCHWPGCDYQTTNSIRYRYHLQKHDGSVPVYECQAIDCNFKTKMKDAFDIHMNTKHK